MWLLAVDTSTRDASVALLRDDHLVVLAASPGEEPHSVRLFRDIERVLGEAELSLADLDAYGVANGPGAFTALRIGLTAVKALAEMHAKPVVGVSVLEAVCESATADGLLVPIVDAYRGEVFAGLYQKHNREIAARQADAVLPLTEFLERLSEQGVDPREGTLVGPGLARWTTVLERSPFAHSRREPLSPVLAEAVGRRARLRLARGEAVDALHLEAHYVRRSDAERLWKQK